MSQTKTAPKPGFFAGTYNRIAVFFEEVKVEMGKVIWPTQENLKIYTMVVIVSSATLAIVLALMDVISTRLMSLITNLVM